MILKKRRTPTLEMLEDRINPAAHHVTTLGDMPVVNETTFRQAIFDANRDTDAAVSIDFTLGAGVQTIELAANLGKLEDITKKVTINGLAAGRTIVIDGKNFPRGQGDQPVDGLTILKSNCKIEGLTIRNFSGYGIVINGTAADVMNVKVIECHIEENRGAA